MKVERKETFEPVTITLESQEECEIIWHLLNMSILKYPDYFHKDKINGRIKSDMWQVFDGKFHQTY
jgi:hypothetical protein